MCYQVDIMNVRRYKLSLYWNQVFKSWYRMHPWCMLFDSKIWNIFTLFFLSVVLSVRIWTSQKAIQRVCSKYCIQVFVFIQYGSLSTRYRTVWDFLNKKKTFHLRILSWNFVYQALTWLKLMFSLFSQILRYIDVHTLFGKLDTKNGLIRICHVSQFCFRKFKTVLDSFLLECVQLSIVSCIFCCPCEKWK